MIGLILLILILLLFFGRGIPSFAGAGDILTLILWILVICLVADLIWAVAYTPTPIAPARPLP